MNKKKTDIATTHTCKHHFTAELVGDQHCCTISCCSMTTTSFNLTPKNDPSFLSLLSSSPPLLDPGRNLSQISTSENEAKILMLPVLPPYLEDDEWNRKNSTIPPLQMHLKKKLKMTPRFHSEGQFAFVSTSSSNMTMEPIPLKMNTTILSKDEAQPNSCSRSESPFSSCSRNESPFSIEYFRPIQFLE